MHRARFAAADEKSFVTVQNQYRAYERAHTRERKTRQRGEKEREREINRVNRI